MDGCLCANNSLGERIIVCVISHLAVLQQLVHDGAVAPPCGVVQVEGWRHAHTDLGVVSDTTTQVPQHQGNNKYGQSAGVAHASWQQLPAGIINQHMLVR